MIRKANPLLAGLHEQNYEGSIDQDAKSKDLSDIQTRYWHESKYKGPNREIYEQMSLAKQSEVPSERVFSADPSIGDPSAGPIKNHLYESQRQKGEVDSREQFPILSTDALSAGEEAAQIMSQNDASQNNMHKTENNFFVSKQNMKSQNSQRH